MPESQMRVLWKAHPYSPGTLIGTKRHTTIHILQYNCILIKEIVLQRNPTFFFQCIQFILTIQVTVFRKSHTSRMCRIAEFQNIVFKVKSFFQRYIESRMTTNAKKHCFFIMILYFICNLQCTAIQLISQEIRKCEWILHQCLFIAVITKCDTALRCTIHCQITVFDKSMDLHVIFFSLIHIGLIRQSCNIREQVRSLSIPYFRNALPEILTSIRCLNRM